MEHLIQKVRNLIEQELEKGHTDKSLDLEATLDKIQEEELTEEEANEEIEDILNN